MAYDVGDLYQNARRTYQPATQYSFRSGRHELALMLADPTEDQIKTLSKCRAEVALYAEGDVVIFLYKFDGVFNWTELAFSYHLIASEERALPDDPTGLRRVVADRIDIVFVNEETQVVEGIRSNRFTHPFTVAIREALIAQAKTPWVGKAMWERQIRQIYAKNTNIHALLLDCVAQCTLQGLEVRW